MYSSRLLCLLLLLYIPLQWVVGRHPGSTSIFSSQHHRQQRDFLRMDGALGRQLVAQCTQHGIRDIYFSDGDVVSPYLINQAPAPCAFHRETEVTPIAPAPKLACSAVVVDESLPDAWNPVHHWDTLGPVEQSLAALNTWETEDKDFGFRILQARNCPHADQIAANR